MNKPQSLFKAAGFVLAATIVGAIGYGQLAPAQAVPIWTKDASNVVQLSPKTLAVNLASSTAVTFPASSTFAGAILSDCTTASFNPGNLVAVTTSTTASVVSATSTDIAFAGAALSDICVASFTLGTSTPHRIGCEFSGTATSTFTIENKSTALGLDYATGTVRVCRFR